MTAVTISVTAANRQMPQPTVRPASSGLPSPIFWPSSTRSPALTRLLQGAPTCWDRRIATCAGAGMTSTGSFPVTALPPKRSRG